MHVNVSLDVIHTCPSLFVAVVVRHLVGDNHRDFYHAGDFSVDAPGRLINHLALSVLGDGVGVDSVAFHHVANHRLGALVMAREEVLPHHRLATLVECLA